MSPRIMIARLSALPTGVRFSRKRLRIMIAVLFALPAGVRFSQKPLRIMIAALFALLTGIRFSRKRRRTMITVLFVHPTGIRFSQKARRVMIAVLFVLRSSRDSLRMMEHFDPELAADGDAAAIVGASVAGAQEAVRWEVALRRP